MMETDWLFKRKPILPLVVFRTTLGAVLFISTLRFIVKGWVTEFYVTPALHFPFFGMEWLKPLPAAGMYMVYAAMTVFAFGICAGFFYRWSAAGFCLLFTYAGLLDKTYYLNHYYLITVLTFLLVLVPANAAFSLDVERKATCGRKTVPAWSIRLFQWQLAVIYICAGLSKITPDWLLEAVPLRIWLPAKGYLPLLGPLLRVPVTAYLFSWASAIFDLGVVFLLWNRKTRSTGYFFVLLFHSLTAFLFQIGMFPWLMITSTLIFFPASAWRWLPGGGKGVFSFVSRKKPLVDFCGDAETDPSRFEKYYPRPVRRHVVAFLAIYFLFQVLIPFRFLLYPGKLLWTEEGYRFSWRVMLMEKSGISFFYVTDPVTGMKKQVVNREFLTAYQERMMETQPDMMLQYAQKLKGIFKNRGIREPKITVESYVSLNGHRSRLFVDSSLDLASEHTGSFCHLAWINPFTQNGNAK